MGRRGGRLIGRLLVASLVLAWALPAGAQSGAADGPAATPARLEELFQQSRRNPTDLDLLYELANTAVALEDYETAISALERMLIFNPELPRVRLELGVLYFRLGSFEIARLQLERALETPELPGEVRTRVEEYLEAITRRTAASDWSAEFTAGGRYQTNPSASADPTDVRIGDLVFRTTGDAGSDFSLFAVGRLSHLYRFDTQWDDSLLTRLQTYAETYAEQSELDVTVVSLDSGPDLGLGRVGLETAYARPFLTAGHTTLDWEYYYYWLGGGLELRAPVGPVELRLRGSLRRQVYSDTDEAAYGDRTGWREELSVGGSLPIGAAGFLDGFTYLEHAGASRDYSAYHEIGMVLLAGRTFDLPERFGVGPLGIYGGGSLATVRYQGEDPVVEPDTRRRDWSYGVRGGLTLDVTTRLSLLAEVEHRLINSNVSVYEYDNTAVTAGVRLHF